MANIITKGYDYKSTFLSSVNTIGAETSEYVVTTGVALWGNNAYQLFQQKVTSGTVSNSYIFDKHVNTLKYVDSISLVGTNANDLEVTINGTRGGVATIDNDYEKTGTYTIETGTYWNYKKTESSSGAKGFDYTISGYREGSVCITSDRTFSATVSNLGSISVNGNAGYYSVPSYGQNQTSYTTTGNTLKLYASMCNIPGKETYHLDSTSSSFSTSSSSMSTYSVDVWKGYNSTTSERFSEEIVSNDIQTVTRKTITSETLSITTSQSLYYTTNYGFTTSSSTTNLIVPNITSTTNSLYRTSTSMETLSIGAEHFSISTKNYRTYSTESFEFDENKWQPEYNYDYSYSVTASENSTEVDYSLYYTGTASTRVTTNKNSYIHEVLTSYGGYLENENEIVPLDLAMIDGFTVDFYRADSNGNVTTLDYNNILSSEADYRRDSGHIVDSYIDGLYYYRTMAYYDVIYPKATVETSADDLYTTYIGYTVSCGYITTNTDTRALDIIGMTDISMSSSSRNRDDIVLTGRAVTLYSDTYTDFYTWYRVDNDGYLTFDNVTNESTYTGDIKYFYDNQYNTVSGKIVSCNSYNTAFYVYDTGTRNKLCLSYTNASSITIDSVTTENGTTVKSGNFRTQYCVSLDAKDDLEAYKSFSTDYSTLRIYDSSSDGQTISEYVKDLAFTYVIPEKNFDYELRIYVYDSLMYSTLSSLSNGYMDGGYTYIPKISDYHTYYSGIMEEGKPFCIASHGKFVSSRIYTTSKKFQITTSEWVSAPPAMGGGSDDTSTLSISSSLGYFYQEIYPHNVTRSDKTYTYNLSALTELSSASWGSTYTYSTKRTFYEETRTTWYSSLVSAQWDTVTTVTSVGYSATYSTKWFSPLWSGSCDAGFDTYVDTTRTSTTTTGYQIMNQHHSDTYLFVESSEYTGVSWYSDKRHKYHYTLQFREQYDYSDKYYYGVKFTANFPEIYQSITATEYAVNSDVRYVSDSNGQTNYIQSSISLYITSDKDFDITMQTGSHYSGNYNSEITYGGTKSTKTSKIFLTSHVELYTRLASEGWYNTGCHTAGLSQFIPDVQNFSDMTNFSGVRVSTDYINFTYSTNRVYDSESFTDYYDYKSMITCDIYRMYAGTKAEFVQDAYSIQSYSTINYDFGEWDKGAYVLFGTSYTSPNDYWTVSHISMKESIHAWKDTADGKDKRTTVTVEPETVIETVRVYRPDIYNSAVSSMVSSMMESNNVSTGPFGTTIVNGTFYTCKDTDYNYERTFANGTWYETGVNDKMISNALATLDRTISDTYIRTYVSTSGVKGTVTDYASWRGKTYTGYSVSQLTQRNGVMTMVKESDIRQTDYDYTGTFGNYYMTTEYGGGYTLTYGEQTTSIGTTSVGGVLTREYYLHASNYTTSSEKPFATFTSTANEKVTKVLTSTVGYKDVTYYDTYYGQTVKALGEYKDMVTKYTTVSALGVERESYEPSFITAIKNKNYTTSCKKAVANKMSTYVVSGSITRTVGVGY